MCRAIARSTACADRGRGPRTRACSSAHASPVPSRQHACCSTTTSEPAVREVRGQRVKVVLSFGVLTEPLLVKVGVSAVSSEGASANIDAENPAWDFERVRRDADEEWERELSKIRVTGGTLSAAPRLLLGALPRAAHAQRVHGRRRQLPGPRRPGAPRRWVHLLLGLLAVGHVSRAASAAHDHRSRRGRPTSSETFLRQFEQGGRLPVWELWGNETDTMIGYHAVPVIADAWLKGIDGFDHDLAWRAHGPQRRGGPRRRRRIHARRVRARRTRARERVQDAGVRVRRLDDRHGRQAPGPRRTTHARFLARVAGLEAPLRPRHAASCARARTASGWSRSTPRRSTSTTPRRTRGSTASTSRTTSPA